jgi:hypothetical protein
MRYLRKYPRHRHVLNFTKLNKIYIDNPQVVIENRNNELELIDSNQTNLGKIVDMIQLQEVFANKNNRIIPRTKPKPMKYDTVTAMPECGCTNYFFCCKPVNDVNPSDYREP